jgi:hypothetical protein
VATVAVDFLDEENEIVTTVVDALVTAQSVITVNHASEDLGIQGVQFSAIVDPGVGYDVYGYAPVGASGQYNVTAIIQEGA